uniref:Cyanovirin-N domain-containing protein n=1 Tax=Bionectria ochroleuca TaxID=29856 RepID=A0A8H7K4L0_BIOOC
MCISILPPGHSTSLGSNSTTSKSSTSRQRCNFKTSTAMASFLKSILLLIQLSGQALALPYYDDPPALTTTSVGTQTSFELSYETLAVREETNSTDTSFMQSCRDLVLDLPDDDQTKSPRLSANCVQLGGNKSRCASINLSNCIANRGGSLSWARDGNFHTSCRNCGMDSAGNLACKCHENKDTVYYTSIRLHKAIRNEDGRLACKGYTSNDDHCPASN